MIPDQLRIRPGQERLSPEQEEEAERFAQARLAAQLSTEPADEREAERFLKEAYVVAGLPPPERIHWVDGPLQLMAALTPRNVRGDLYERVRSKVRERVDERVQAGVGLQVYESVRERVQRSVWTGVWENVGSSVQASVRERARPPIHEHAWMSMRASRDASMHAFYRFFDEYLAPNALHALAHLNELVSACWLRDEVAVLVRRPRVLSRDQEGALHSERGKCIEYHDGWGVYAWHGVRVPERVILTPEALTREDFVFARSVEERRVIQERMGERFVSELGGVVLDQGPRGTLYEVRLPADDPERVARYVQVQDASSERRYFLRVPPIIQTAAEAVAWTFQVGVEDYRPAQET